jgi:hypothetical protein
MNFNTYQAPYQPFNYNGFSGVNMAVAPKPIVRPVALNAPMIERVHKAKPGCSACGKKIA